MKPITTDMEQAAQPAPDTDSQQDAKVRLAGRIGPSMRPKESVPTINVDKYSVREVQAMCPLPEQLDPFTEALLSGVDPMSVHQALTLTFPMLAFLGSNTRVLYASRKLRWMCGLTWQMGGSGCGKSTVLRSLEDLLLCKEIAEKDAAARRIREYSQLSEEERKKTPKPKEKLFIFDGIPTGLALMEQMQINDGGAIYISCTECGELAKKIGSRHFSIVLDMIKKSHDETGEPFLYKTSERTLYVSSMKICANIGGTEDQMYKVLHHCDSDGTLSRSAVVMLGEPKDEDTEGEYKDPSWTKEQVKILVEGANRLRNFDNTYRENLNDNLNLNHNENSDEESDQRVYEGAKDGDGNAPTIEEYNFSVQEERVRRALCVPEIITFGKEIKRELSRIGEITTDCCSRANELAQAICYLLYVANGLADVSEKERDGAYFETLRRIMDVSRWWIYRSIDAAVAVQTQLNANSKSQREGIRVAYKRQASGRLSDMLREKREAAFRDFEEKYDGMKVNANALRVYDVFASMDRSQLRRLILDRGYEYVARNLFCVVRKGGGE